MCVTPGIFFCIYKGINTYRWWQLLTRYLTLHLYIKKTIYLNYVGIMENCVMALKQEG